MHRFKWVAVILALIMGFGCFPVGGIETASASTNAPDWDTSVLRNALTQAPRSMQIGDFKWSTTLKVSEAMYISALAAYYEPDLTVSNINVANRVVEHLRKITQADCAPSARGSLGGWVDNPIAQAMVLAKNTPAVWNQLTDQEKQKLDFIMCVMAVTGNYTQNYDNDPCSDLSQDYWWHKGWNPNHQEGYVGVMIAANLYFGGADNVNRIFTDPTYEYYFEYDKYIQKMTEYGYSDMKRFYQTTGKKLLEEGGRDTNERNESGTLVGVRIPFTYQSLAGPRKGEKIEYDPLELYKCLAYHMYGKKVVSKYVNSSGVTIGYIVDGSTSPYQGLNGMGTEFDSMDEKGIRTDAGYINSGWRNSVPTRATLEALGVWDSVEMAEIESIMYVGSEDFLYKVSPEHGGYRGWQKGHASGPTTEDEFEGQGFYYYKEIWQKILKKDGMGFAPELNKSGDKLKATLYGYNLSSTDDREVTAIFAVYDSQNRLVDIQSDVCSIPKLTEYNGTKAIFSSEMALTNPDDYKVKFLVWDSIEGMRPVTTEVSYGI